MTDQKDRQRDHGIAAPIITLIHGTWAREAGWTQEGSCFQRRLREKLNGPVNFRRFEWSGRNSHTDRLHAGEALREHLKTEFEAAPQATHVVIAHSHGGNVVLYALQDDQLRARIDGLVCLATPFLQVRPRHLRRRLFWAAGIYLAYALLVLVASLIYGSGRPKSPNPLLLGLLFAGALPLLTPMFLLLLSLLKGSDKRFGLWAFLKTRRERSELVESLRLPVLGTKKLLIIRPSGDEASGALTVSQFFTWILGRTWNFTDLVYSKCYRAFEVTSRLFVYGVLIGILILILTIVLGPWVGFVDLLFPEPLTNMFLQWVARGMIGTIVIGFPLLPIGWFACFILGLVLFSHYPFGFDAMLLSFELETTAEASPPGEARVFQVSMPEPRLPTAKRLAHSRIYDNEDVVDAIASWIKSHGGSTYCAPADPGGSPSVEAGQG